MTILVVEDDPEAAEAVLAVLARHGFVAEVAPDGAAGLARAGDPAVRLVILDRMLPGLDGMAVLARLRGAGLDMPVLMLTALGRLDQRVAGLEIGADDYLAKPFEPDELVARVRALLRRTPAAQPRQPVLFHGDIELHLRARTAHRAGRHLALSPKEFDLLRFLMEQNGDIATREMLLREVWHLSFDPQTNVVDVNMVRLRRKLDAGCAASCLETVRGVGYRLVTR